MTAVPRAMREAIESAREEVCIQHQALWSSGLVAWTSGNVSARVPGTGGSPDLMVIKPSGVDYDDLTPESMVVCDLDGSPAEDWFRPSSDTGAHAYVYRHMQHVGGVV